MADRRTTKADEEVRPALSMDDQLPQCKIKRNYSCTLCRYYTQNPRSHLTHLRDIHGERITINKCNLCLYASRHYQKLVRHMKMVHGSTDGIAGQLRKRASPESSVYSPQQSKPPTPPLPPLVCPVEEPAQSGNLWEDLVLSRKTLMDIAALYFAENDIGRIMNQMETADNALLFPSDGEGEYKAPDSSFVEEIEKSFSHGGDFKSKSFSETIIHRSNGTWESPSVSDASCQYCRCCFKSTEELANHLKNCLHYEIFQRSRCQGLSLAGMESLPWKRADMVTPPDDEVEGGDSEVCPTTSSAFKKVFKCPRCSFWASTASRFHVHVVGHLNKKPFKCSLCTYRSNWRWDITKHIRLKSIRNPCHKTARVLMNDDTGRRNYTKYNKYLTLMKINDEDGDARLIKSGEMTPNQVASLGYLGKSAPSDLANDVAATECEEESKEVELAEENQAPSPIVKFSDDLVTGVRSDGLKNERFFKCRKCCFRHANRDAVLAHIRIHYQNPLMGQPSSTSKADHRSSLQMAENPEEVDTATSLPRNRMSHKETTAKAAVNFRELDAAVQKTPPPSGDANLEEPTPGPTGQSTNAVAGSNFSDLLHTPEKRVSSPFRCGHCHQVSNWKHVIQRHCRLKHSGNIQIEAFDRNSRARSPVYRPIDFCGMEQKRPSKAVAADNSSAGVQHQIPSFPDSSSMATKGKNDLHQRGSSVSHDGVLVKRVASSPKIKCPSLPVAQEPPQFKCTVCPYICAKKQHLTNHLKAHEFAPKLSADSGEVELPSAVEPTYRQKCPERSVSAPGEQKQCQKGELKSETNQETMLMSHSLVRSGEFAKQSHDDPALQSNVTITPIDAGNTTMTASNHNSLNGSRSGVSAKDFVSYETFQSHLQRGAHLCEYCDFESPSKEDLHEHTRLHFKSSANRNSAASSTSFDKLELTVAHNCEKKNQDEKVPNRPTTVSIEEKKEKLANIRKRRCSTDENTATRAAASQKTIIFNRKTGQVIRRK